MILEVAEGYPGNVKKRILFGSAASKGGIPSTELSYSSYPSPKIFFVLFLNSKMPSWKWVSCSSQVITECRKVS